MVHVVQTNRYFIYVYNKYLLMYKKKMFTYKYEEKKISIFVLAFKDFSIHTQSYIYIPIEKKKPFKKIKKAPHQQNIIIRD